MDLESGRTPIAYEESPAYSELDLKIKLSGANKEPAGRDHAKTAPKSRKSRAFHHLSVLLFVLALLLALPTVYFVLPKIFNDALVGRGQDDCGPSIEEAKAKGCVFDNMSYAWVQPACHYEELLTYRKQPEIPYYSE